VLSPTTSTPSTADENDDGGDDDQTEDNGDRYYDDRHFRCIGYIREAEYFPRKRLSTNMRLSCIVKPNSLSLAYQHNETAHLEIVVLRRMFRSTVRNHLIVLGHIFSCCDLSMLLYDDAFLYIWKLQYNKCMVVNGGQMRVVLKPESVSFL